ncbi:MAG: DUF512 domain-containing protein [Christensenellaceae bacterium]
MSNIVKKVNAEGIAQECGICVGDEVVSVNGDQIIDYIDYEYYMADEFITLLVKKTDGEELEIEIEKDAYEDLGIEFIDDGFRKKICCQNKCLFCFVDQMPKGRRKTLYVKDDDWRLSFLMGNYVTLTNITQKEIDRIISKHISPLYLSVHASDKKIRKFLFGRENAADTFEIMKIFAENGIQMHTQIVMCEGINDGQVLKQTLEELCGLFPNVLSVAVVPVGLTKYRENLYPLKPVSKENAVRTIEMIYGFQKQMLKYGTRFVFAADEMYIRAKLPLPEFDEYEEFIQIENGVGLVTKFLTEAQDALAEMVGGIPKFNRVNIATGADFYPFMCDLAQKIKQVFHIDIEVFEIKNTFFGDTITVTGLLTGRDIVKQLKGKLKNGVLLLSDVCFKENEHQMLDDMTLEEMEQNLNVPCIKAGRDGYELIETIVDSNR